jgi:hypothetical protein
MQCDNNEPQKIQETEPRDEAAVPAWEEIENGRYRPRRIRGSYHGRELG